MVADLVVDTTPSTGFTMNPTGSEDPDDNSITAVLTRVYVRSSFSASSPLAASSPPISHANKDSMRAGGADADADDNADAHNIEKSLARIASRVTKTLDRVTVGDEDKDDSIKSVLSPLYVLSPSSSSESNKIHVEIDASDVEQSLARIAARAAETSDMTMTMGCRSNTENNLAASCSLSASSVEETCDEVEIVGDKKHKSDKDENERIEQMNVVRSIDDDQSNILEGDDKESKEAMATSIDKSNMKIKEYTSVVEKSEEEAAFFKEQLSELEETQNRHREDLKEGNTSMTKVNEVEQHLVPTNDLCSQLEDQLEKTKSKLLNEEGNNELFKVYHDEDLKGQQLLILSAEKKMQDAKIQEDLARKQLEDLQIGTIEEQLCMATNHAKVVEEYEGEAVILQKELESTQDDKKTLHNVIDLALKENVAIVADHAKILAEADHERQLQIDVFESKKKIAKDLRDVLKEQQHELNIATTNEKVAIVVDYTKEIDDRKLPISTLKEELESSRRSNQTPQNEFDEAVKEKEIVDADNAKAFTETIAEHQLLIDVAKDDMRDEQNHVEQLRKEHEETRSMNVIEKEESATTCSKAMEGYNTSTTALQEELKSIQIDKTTLENLTIAAINAKVSINADHCKALAESATGYLLLIDAAENSERSAHEQISLLEKELEDTKIASKNEKAAIANAHLTVVEEYKMWTAALENKLMAAQKYNAIEKEKSAATYSKVTESYNTSTAALQKELKSIRMDKTTLENLTIAAANEKVSINADHCKALAESATGYVLLINAAENSVRGAQEQISHLEKELEDMKIVSKNEKAEIADALMVVEEYKMSTAALEDKLMAAKKYEQQCEDQIAAAEKENTLIIDDNAKTLANIMADHQSLIDTATNNVHDLKERLDHLRTEHEETEIVRADEKALIIADHAKVLTNTMTDHQLLIETSENNVRDLKQQIDNLKTEQQETEIATEKSKEELLTVHEEKVVEYATKISILKDDFSKEKASNKLLQDLIQDQQLQTNAAKAGMLHAQDEIEHLRKQLKNTKIAMVHAKAAKLHKRLELAAEEKACVIANHAKKISGWGVEELNATREKNEKLLGKLLEKKRPQNVSDSTEGELNSGFGEFEEKANAVHSHSTTKVVPKKANTNMELQQKANSMSIAKSSATREMQSLLSSRSEHFMLMKKGEAKAPRAREEYTKKQHDANIKKVVFDENNNAHTANHF